MKTPTELANIALGLIGQPPISDFLEPSAAAEAVRLHWDLTRQACLRGRQWNFAVRRAVLVRLAAAPAFGFAYAYHLPDKYLLACEVNGKNAGTGEATHEIEGAMLLTDEESVQLRYVEDIQDSTSWDSSFDQYFCAALAAAVAPFLTNSQSMAEGMMQLAEKKRLAAMGPDNLESRPRSILATSGEGWASRILGYPG
jgi:hypothetical protein